MGARAQTLVASVGRIRFVVGASRQSHVMRPRRRSLSSTEMEERRLPRSRSRPRTESPLYIKPKAAWGVVGRKCLTLRKDTRPPAVDGRAKPGARVDGRLIHGDDHVRSRRGGTRDASTVSARTSAGAPCIIPRTIFGEANARGSTGSLSRPHQTQETNEPGVQDPARTALIIQSQPKPTTVVFSPVGRLLV